MSGEVNFLHSDKHESLLQNDAMILLEFAKHSQSSQNGKFAMFLLYLRKKSKMKLVFCMQINIKFFYKVIHSILMWMIKHSEGSQSNKFAISLQYLKKEVRSGVHFLHTDKSFYKLESSLLMEVPRHAQSTQNSKLPKFLQYIKKKLL